MKTMFLSVILFAAVGLVVTWASSRTALAEEQPKGVSIPKSCTIMAMAPAERALHLARLGILHDGAGRVRIVPDGFSFEVDLREMPARDLQGWAENEQKCCSFLRIATQIIDAGRRATVHVVCDAGYKPEVIESFGLKAGTQAPVPDKVH